MADITPTTPTPTVLPNTSQNVSNFLASYQPTASTIYSPTNVQQATTAPATTPNLQDPLGLYSYYMETPEMKAAQSAYQTAQNKLTQFDTSTQKANLGLENQTVSMNVIRGEQAQLNQQAALTRQGIANEVLASQSSMEALRQTAQDKLNLAIQQRSELTNLITQYPGAKISYADSIESAMKKVTKYQEKTAEDDYNKTLKQTMLQLGLSTKTKKGGTMKAKDMEKALTDYYKSEASSKKDMAAIDLALKKKELAKPYYEPKSANTLNIDKSNKGISALIEQGANSGDSWEQIAQTLTAAGIGTQSGSFADKYLRYYFGLDSQNPNEQ